MAASHSQRFCRSFSTSPGARARLADRRSRRHPPRPPRWRSGRRPGRLSTGQSASRAGTRGPAARVDRRQAASRSAPNSPDRQVFQVRPQRTPWGQPQAPIWPQGGAEVAAVAADQRRVAAFRAGPPGDRRCAAGRRGIGPERRRTRGRIADGRSRQGRRHADRCPSIRRSDQTGWSAGHSESRYGWFPYRSSGGDAPRGGSGDSRTGRRGRTRP